MQNVTGEVRQRWLALAGQDKEEARCGWPGKVPAWRRYSVAALCVLVAFAGRYFLRSIVGEELPFMLFVAASLVAAWYGGAVTGIVALTLGLFLADYFFIPAHELSRFLEAVHLFRYVFTASLGIALIEVLHRDRRRVEASLEQLQREVERRKKSEAELQKAQAQLAGHAQELEHHVAERTAELAAMVGSLKELLYHIAHNFRAPLRAMAGFTTLLQSEYRDKLDGRAWEYVAHVGEAAERMDRLIEALLAYGRLGHVHLSLAAVDLKQALDRVLFQLAYEIKSRGAEVLVPASLPAVVANAEVLEQVLSNLLENALQFVPPRVIPRIVLRAETRGSNVRLWLEDNGLGIDPRFHTRIFRAFETLHAHPQEGTGIGLAIVKQGVQRMGGNVGVESVLGTGSRFWLELPAAIEADSGQMRN